MNSVAAADSTANRVCNPITLPDAYTARFSISNRGEVEAGSRAMIVELGALWMHENGPAKYGKGSIAALSDAELQAMHVEAETASADEQKLAEFRARAARLHARRRKYRQMRDCTAATLRARIRATGFGVPPLDNLNIAALWAIYDKAVIAGHIG